MGKKAIVTGITGQDGSYLADLLLNKGYYVVGLKRRSSTSNVDRISNIVNHSRFRLEEFEISDSGSVYSAIERHKPDELYNLAAQSHVGTSFDQPTYTTQVNTIGVINLLEGIRRFSPETRFYQASTSEMFGKNVDSKNTIEEGCEKEYYQDEDTSFEPQSPYGAAKLASHHLVRIYRDGHDLHASCGILFNHESERRGELFVTRKITKWIGEFAVWLDYHGVEPQGLVVGDSFLYIPERAQVCRGFEFPKLRLGNVDAYRDWGHAEDYVKAMHLMLQQDSPDDYVIATGETHSVRDFLIHAFKHINIDNYEDFFVVDPEFYRASEVDYLHGKPAKAFSKLGWEPNVSFEQLVQRMVESDINAEKEKAQTPLLSTRK